MKAQQGRKPLITEWFFWAYCYEECPSFKVSASVIAPELALGITSLKSQKTNVRWSQIVLILNGKFYINEIEHAFNSIA